MRIGVLGCQPQHQVTQALDLLLDKHNINFITTYLSGHVKYIPSLHLLDLCKLTRLV